MAGALRAKALEDTREITTGGVDGYIDFRPPVGKIWWFKALRYAIELRDAFFLFESEGGWASHDESRLSLRRVGLTQIDLATWRAGGTMTDRQQKIVVETGEITTGAALAATNGEWLRVAWRIGYAPVLAGAGPAHGLGRWTLNWIGVEADLI